MKDKSEVFQLFVNFNRIIQTQFGSPIKRLCSDNEREYVNQNLSNFLKDNGVVHQLTCVDTPQQNGIAERKNWHEPTSSPIQHKEDIRFGNQYKRRKIPDLVQQQLQSSKLEVRTHTLEDTLDASCESNLDDLSIALRKGKRSCAKYLIYQFVSTKNLSLQH